MSSLKKRIGKNVPMFMRTSVSDSFLRSNPIYKNVFKKCGGCGKYSLKPKMNISQLSPENLINVKERLCAICGFIQKLD